MINKLINNCVIKTKRAIALFVLCFTFNFAQTNLISNPSFEDTIVVPRNHSQLNVCSTWSTQIATPDFFCAFSPSISPSPSISIVQTPKNVLGFQIPKNGFNYVGLSTKSKGASPSFPFANYYESIQGKTTQALKSNHVYDFKLFYSLADGCGIASNQLQVYFTENLFTPVMFSYVDPNTYYNNLQAQIQNATNVFMTDTMKWVQLQNCFIAQGGEKFISIGNYRDGNRSKYIDVINNPVFANTQNNIWSYLYIDDLSLYDIGYYSGKAAAKKDTVICNGVSYTIGNNLKDSANITWWPSAGLSCTNCLNPVASPTVTTKYYVQKTLGCISSKDSITLSVYTPSTSAYAGKSATLCLNDKLQLGTNDVNAYSTYTWQPTQYLNCYYCPQPMATAQSNITYTLSRQECSSTSSSTIDIYIDNCELLLPQGFSPNNDGINDDLLINLPFTTEAKLTVFNRWGNVLFEQSSTMQGTNVKYPLSLQLNWDGKAQKGIMIEKGKLVPAGTYFYLIEATHNDGSKKVYKEFVQVVY